MQHNVALRDKGVDVVYLSADSARGMEVGINAEILTFQVQLNFFLCVFYESIKSFTYS